MIELIAMIGTIATVAFILLLTLIGIIVRLAKSIAKCKCNKQKVLSSLEERKH